MIAKQLTDNTWILTADLGQHVALVMKREGLFISTHNSNAYESLEQIADEFSEKLTIKKNQKEEQTIDVMGFPIKHSVAFDIQNTDGYPTYKAKETANVRFAAGWWVVPFESGYRAGVSPKTTTLIPGSEGPFKDKFSANIILNNLSKRKEINA